VENFVETVDNFHTNQRFERIVPMPYLNCQNYVMISSQKFCSSKTRTEFDKNLNLLKNYKNYAKNQNKSYVFFLIQW